MASCRHIPRRICPSKGLGRLSKARLMSWMVFWSHFHPIGHTIQELCHASRLGSKELSFSSRNILVRVVKVHFTIFLAVSRRRTWNTGSCFGTKNYILASILGTISGTILRTLQKDALWILDIVSIKNKNLRYWVRYSISMLFVHLICIQYRGFDSIFGKISNIIDRISISGYKDIRYQR